MREIQGHLEEMYGTEVSPSLISAVTDAVSEDVKVWQARPLDPLYPILYLDCIHVKVRDAGAGPYETFVSSYQFYSDQGSACGAA